MFDHFSSHQFESPDATIHYRIGGAGPPLVLLHGYPQTHVIWHKIADTLAQHFTVVASDLRGYGDSSKKPGTAGHTHYSKRAMAADQVALMHHLGFSHFRVAGHDRGGRVAHRMALDYPEVITQMAVLDIAPTLAMYQTTDMDFAKAYYHWFFLIQPFDLPERLIGSDPAFFLEKKLGQWGRDRSAITEAAFNEYLRCFTPATIHASCEDYRASATIDLQHDETDLKAGKRLRCPLLCLWGAKGFVGQHYDVIAEWQKWATEVKGFALPCGHYLPEEAPDATVHYLLDFFNE